MNPVYENVAVCFKGNEYKLLKKLFSYLPCLFRSNRSKVQEFIDKNESSLDSDLTIVLETICDLYSLDCDNNNDLLSVIHQFRDM